MIPDVVRREEERIRRAYAARGSGEGEVEDARYSWLSAGHQLIAQGAERGLLRALARAGVRTLARSRVLEVGCGSGQWLRALVQWGARPEHVTGIDLQLGRLAEARSRCAGGVGLAAASGASLPFADGTFDAVLQSTVFTSILDPAVRRAVAGEMLRVLRPGGVVLWYDFLVDNPRNPDVRGVRRGEVRALFPGCRVELRRITLAPPLARALAPRLRPLAVLLSAIPPLCTHLVGSIERT
ncbi:MAG TPA: class I SAM-dependent methyltransferase [Gemmatimonadaceae bacterium]